MQAVKTSKLIVMPRRSIYTELNCHENNKSWSNNNKKSHESQAK